MQKGKLRTLKATMQNPKNWGGLTHPLHLEALESNSQVGFP